MPQQTNTLPTAKDHEPTSRQDAAMTAVVAVAVMVALVGFLPRLPAAWQGITHVSAIGDHGARAGKVTVTRCVRGPLLLDWKCSGRWSVNDLEAQDLPPVANMTMMNDTRHHAVGTSVDALYQPGDPTHGYLWGRWVQGITLLYWIGAALCTIALILAIAGRRRRSRGLTWTAGASLLLSMLILLLVRTAM